MAASGSSSGSGSRPASGSSSGSGSRPASGSSSGSGSRPDLTVDVRTPDGAVSGSVELPGEFFGAPVNVPVMHQVVVAQLAAARAGTSKVKTRAEVRGGGRKPWRQKGTGRSRQGSIRSPQWAGGGVAHGPSGKENHSKRVPKKLKRIALRSALSDRAGSGDVLVVEGLSFEQPRTKDAVALLAALEVTERRVLLVLASWDEVTAKSFRNLSGVHLLSVDQLNTYDVLASDVVVFQREALGHVGARRGADAEPAGEGTGTDEEVPA